MTGDIKEADWKIFKQVRESALERFCGRVLDEIAGLLSDSQEDAHDRYVAIYRLVKKRDKELERTFDYLRRSTAVLQLATMKSLDLVTEEEYERFSVETRDVADHLLSLWSRESGPDGPQGPENGAR
jgi:hypothetical protein